MSARLGNMLNQSDFNASACVDYLEPIKEAINTKLAYNQYIKQTIPSSFTSCIRQPGLSLPVSVLEKKWRDAKQDQNLRILTKPRIRLR